jgi:hypothetical protein
MKRFLLTLILAITLLMGVGDVWAQSATSGASSGLKTTSAAIATSAGVLTGALIITDGSNAATLTLYDHASTNSGTVLFKATVAGASNFGGATWEIPIRYKNGIYAVISGTGANYVVYSDKR